jgi:hypothetical protein
MRKRSNVRKWAFWGGVVGLVTAWNSFLNADVDSFRWADLVGMPVLFAGLGALAAWWRNRGVP